MSDQHVSDPEEYESPLVDLTDLPLTELAGLSARDDSALAHSLRRVIAAVNSDHDAVAGFQSAI